MANEEIPKNTKKNRQEELSAVVSSRIQILGLRLLESHAEQKPYDEDLPGRVKTYVTVETHVNKESELEVFPHFTLVVQKKDASPEEVFLRIEARFSILYSLSSLDGLSEENYTAFGERNAVYNVWPYWREFLQSMTVRMGLPPLTLPVFRIGTARLEDTTVLPRKASKGGRVQKAITHIQEGE